MFLLISHNSAIGVYCIKFLGWAMLLQPLVGNTANEWRHPILYDQNFKWRTEGGSGRPDRLREWQRETMNPAPTVRNNSSPNLKAWVSEITSGSRRFNPPLRLSAEEGQEHGAIMSAIGTKCLLCSLFVLLLPISIFFSISLSHRPPLLSLANIINCIQYVVLRLRGLHFHIDGFLGKLENWMLLSWFFFC